MLLFNNTLEFQVNAIRYKIRLIERYIRKEVSTLLFLDGIITHIKHCHTQTTQKAQQKKFRNQF